MEKEKEDNLKAEAQEQVKNRYSDEELEEFRQIILDKIEKARAEYNIYREMLLENDGNDPDDDGSMHLSRQQASDNKGRQEKFIQQLEAALVRIDNKTYGICRATGKLIPKERLRLVPHATLTVEAKEKDHHSR